MRPSRRFVLTGWAACAGGLLAASVVRPAFAAAPRLDVFKTPGCGCCSLWADHMAAAGFDVRVAESPNTTALKTELGIPRDLWSCHTGIVEGYAVEGHVPADDVARLLAERPRAIGLSVPGMPIGSPGMEDGDLREPYEVILFSEGARSVFAAH